MTTMTPRAAHDFRAGVRVRHRDDHAVGTVIAVLSARELAVMWDVPGLSGSQVSHEIVESIYPDSQITGR